MIFRIGQKIVCVDDDDHPEWSPYARHPCAGVARQWIKKGDVYVVRRVGGRKYRLVWIKGIDRRRIEKDGWEYADSGFNAARFRPLNEHDGFVP